MREPGTAEIGLRSDREKNMSLFPTSKAANGLQASCADGLETDGVLVRPIGGQIYLIEETDLADLPAEAMQPRLSGLISRH
jgi:hypothetical protein